MGNQKIKLSRTDILRETQLVHTKMKSEMDNIENRNRTKVCVEYFKMKEWLDSLEKIWRNI